MRRGAGEGGEGVGCSWQPGAPTADVGDPQTGKGAQMSQSTIDTNTEQGEERYAKITDQALDSLRGLIGVPIPDTVEPWCYEATRDNIRHYAHGIGDDNPL